MTPQGPTTKRAWLPAQFCPHCGADIQKYRLMVWSLKCDRCKKLATYIRNTTIYNQYRYGNPYLPPKYELVEKTNTEYACDKHFEEAAKISILGPHRWRHINEIWKTGKKIWSVTVSSESSDYYGPFLFDRELTDKQLEAFLRQECPGEWPDADADYYEEIEGDGDVDGPGFAGSYLHIETSWFDEVMTVKKWRICR